MTTRQRNTISFLTACIGAIAAVAIEGVHTPGEGWKRGWIIFGVAALAIMRLYLFYEGTALAEVSRKKANISFRLSVILSAALAVYGVVIWMVNPLFTNYALVLFLLLQLGLTFTEWVFSTRTGHPINARLNVLDSRVNRTLGYAKHWKMQSKIFQNQLQSLLQKANKIAKEKQSIEQSLSQLRESEGDRAKIYQSLVSSPVRISKTRGIPFCHCPDCAKEGFITILTGGPNSFALSCDKHGEIIKVK